MQEHRSPFLALTILAAAAVSAPGCHTLEGAGAGAAAPFHLQTPLAGSGTDALAVAVVYAGYIVVGAAYGLAQDIAELLDRLDPNEWDAITWDSREGLALRLQRALP